MTRRVVTGLAPDGRSTVLIDDDATLAADARAGLLWRTAAVPADNGAIADPAGQPFTLDLLHDGGSNFMLARYPAGSSAFMHATDTIDYITVLAGRLTLVLEAGEVTVGPGDVIVDRGVLHDWRNDGAEDALAAVVTLPARPVGQGRTV